MNITSTLIIQMIVFLILIWFTMKFVWPPIVAALDDRAKKVAEGLSAADKAKAELANANKRVEQQLAAARDDAAKRLADAERLAQQMVEEAKAKASEEGAKIIAQAQRRGRARGREGARDVARPGGCAGRQGRRADPAQRGQRRRAQRSAEPAEDRALTWPNSQPSRGRMPRHSIGRSSGADALALIPQLQALAAVAGHPDMQQLADNPKVTAKQVLEVITGVAKTTLDPKVSNLLRTVVENGRLRHCRRSRRSSTRW